MTIGAIASRTTKYLFRKLNFDYPYWHAYEHENWDDLDAALSALSSDKGIAGPWQNNIAVTVGQKYIDTTIGDAFTVLIAHTTPASGTFAAARAANPTYWAINTVADNSVTLSKIQDISTDTILGRDTSGTGDPEILTPQQVRDIIGLNANGQCRLTYVNANNLTLVPYNGNKLMIGDRPCVVPSAGMSVGTGGVVANTDYYVFAADVNGDGVIDLLQLALASTGTIKDSTTGVFVSPGDRTRTLVGLVRTTSVPNFVDSPTQRFVRSYYNRVPTVLTRSLGGAATTASTSLVELDTALRVEFVCWDSDLVTVEASAPIFASTGSGASIGPSIDGTSPARVTFGFVTSTETRYFSLQNKSLLSSGYHYATLFASVIAGTGTFGNVSMPNISVSIDS